MKTKKLVALLAISTAAACAVGLAACSGGESSSATKTGDYVSADNAYSYSNFAPNYNYRLLTVTSAQLQTYDDNTYVYTTYVTSTSNLTAGSDVASDAFTANSRGLVVTYYYGTYTADAEEGLTTLTLAKPTNVICQNGGTYYDTANWTDAMATSYLSELNAYTSYGGEAVTETPTATTYLEAKVSTWSASGEVVIVTTVADSISGTFAVIDLS